MGTVFDTARHILEKGGRMSTVKLQRLCYYAQAWSLVWEETPLFDEDFEAWANGPICVVLFLKYKGYFDLTAEDIKDGDSSRLSEKQKENVDSVIEYYGHRNIQYLSRLTHIEDPWMKARAGYVPGEECSNVITKASMALYYGSLDDEEEQSQEDQEQGEQAEQHKEQSQDTCAWSADSIGTEDLGVLSIFDAAKYILEKGGRMSTVKLQRLCYYAQAWFLVWKGAPLFEEDFEAWTNGPICVVLFQKYKGRFDLTAEDIKDGDSSRLSEEQKESVDAVIEHYGCHDIQYLSRLTHLEDPWKKARVGFVPGEQCSNIITKASMALYYGGLD